MAGIKLKKRKVKVPSARAGRVLAGLVRGNKPNAVVSGPPPLDEQKAAAAPVCPCGKPGYKIQGIDGDFCSEACYEEHRRPKAPLGSVGPINALKPGQRFRCDMPKMGNDGGHSLAGYLVYCTAGGALVELDSPPSRRQFKDARSGAAVDFTAARRTRVNWSLLTEVTVLEGTKDFSLQSANDGVQRSRSTNLNSRTPEEGIDMATKKKAAKKTKANGEAKGKRGRAGQFGPEMKIKVLADKNPKREGSAASERFELYGKNKTVESFLAAGGSSRDLAYDVTHGHVEVK